MLGEKLLKLRKKQGLSQQDVADLLDVSRQTISNWECGQGAPALDKADELARLYRVSLDDLINDVEVMTATLSTGKDLHVLMSLKGRSCKLGFSDDALIIRLGNTIVRVLDVNEDWLRVEYRRMKALTQKETVVQLIEVDAIESAVILEGES